MIHPLNEAVHGEQAGFYTNPEVTTLDQGCETSISCDMHYELDWSYRLRAPITCEQASSTDPCFASVACLCDNGFFRIAETMPKVTEADEYDGFKEVLNTFEEVVELINNP